MLLSVTDVSVVSVVPVSHAIDSRRIVKGQYQTKKQGAPDGEGAILRKWSTI